MFRVKANVFQLFCANGLESSQANVEGDGLDLYSLLFQSNEDLGGKVKAGSGGGGGAWFVGKDCLVAVAVLWAVIAVDVGWEWHVTYFVEDSGEVRSGGKA